ncbi:MAG: HupE/UreJ family protein [Elainellaceae cyanobacterium]
MFAFIHQIWRLNTFQPSLFQSNTPQPDLPKMVSRPRRCLYQRISVFVGLMVVIGSVGLIYPSAALAHHPLGGETPASAFEGFISGLAHPILGPDHFAFIVAAGLLAAAIRQGLIIPMAFVLAGLAGTGIHLLNVDMPVPEIFISASVVLFGIMLTLKNTPSLLLITGMGAIAGLFHGYAYGEAIIGAEMTPLIAYLAGFTSIQLAISLAAHTVGKAAMKRVPDQPGRSLRSAGFVICGAGAAFLSAVVLG